VNNKITHFTQLKVWQMSHKLFLDALSDIKRFPKDIGGKVVADQLIRSLGSIGVIAEGFNSNTTKQYISYLNIARNSSAEAENWFYKIRDTNWQDRNLAEERIKVCNDLCKMFYSMINHLERRIRK
jgi:four helix bundle protein